MVKYDFVGIGANKKTIKDYKHTVEYITENLERLVKATKDYPLCMDMPNISFYTVVNSREEICRIIHVLNEEIYRYEHTTWVSRLLCAIFGHTINTGLCARCLRNIRVN